MTNRVVASVEGGSVIQLTADEEAALSVDQSAQQSAQAVSLLKQEAQAALDSSDMTALRCVKAGVSFPKDWQSYVSQLRAIINSGTGTIPTQPAYPAGT